MAKKQSEPPPIEPRVFRSPEEIDAAVAKLRRRIEDLETLDVEGAFVRQSGEDRVVESDVRQTILEVFGPNSPEFREHKYLRIWAGPENMMMSDHAIVQGKQLGRRHVITILNGLIGRLEEKKMDFAAGATAVAAPSSYFDRLNLHPRIPEVSRDRFMDGYPWDAVFAASKALVNYVRERSGSDLDGAPLMRAVFSKNGPVLAFNDLKDQTELDEQEGTMHLFEGAVQAIRNPGGHTFPEGPDQRAIEYISFLSLLAYRVQEAKKK
jgi:uncharacterized protein (TIGR02391 family)